MFIVNLPYSKEEFAIPVVTFKDIFTLSRLKYDNNTAGYIAMLNNIFKFKHLSVIDKFFILLKVRQFFISETITLNNNGKSVGVSVANFTNNLFDIENKRQVITNNNISIELDVPVKFLTEPKMSSMYENILHSVSIGNQKLDLSACSSKDKQELFEVLPPTLMTHFKKFIEDASHNVVLFTSTDNMSVNFVSSQPYEFISLLFSDYDLLSCKEILFALSKRMNSETILNSTISDITTYTSLYNDEIKQQNASGNMGIAL
jgi:hypothetical protein